MTGTVADHWIRPRGSDFASAHAIPKVTIVNTIVNTINTLVAHI